MPMLLNITIINFKNWTSV